MLPDPVQTAMNAKAPVREYYGEITEFIIGWHVFRKGEGRIPYDEEKHDPSDAACTIDIEVTPLADSGLDFAFNRKHTEKEPGWYKITLPSLAALGVRNPMAECIGRYCKFRFTKSGDYYNKRQKKEDGTWETVKQEKDAFTFLALYMDEAECHGAYLQEQGKFFRRKSQGTKPEENGLLDLEDDGPPLPRRTQSPADVPVQRPLMKSAQEGKAWGYVRDIAGLKLYDLEATRSSCRTLPGIRGIIDVDSQEFDDFIAELSATNRGKF